MRVAMRLPKCPWMGGRGRLPLRRLWPAGDLEHLREHRPMRQKGLCRVLPGLWTGRGVEVELQDLLFAREAQRGFDGPSQFQVLRALPADG